MRWVMVLAALAACGESYEGYTSQSMCEEIVVRTCERSENVCMSFTDPEGWACKLEGGDVPLAPLTPWQCCVQRGGCTRDTELLPAYVEACFDALEREWSCEEITPWADMPALPEECR